jgi:hypothetical protein
MSSSKKKSYNTTITCQSGSTRKRKYRGKKKRQGTVTELNFLSIFIFNTKNPFPDITDGVTTKSNNFPITLQNDFT